MGTQLNLFKYSSNEFSIFDRVYLPLETKHYGIIVNPTFVISPKYDAQDTMLYVTIIPCGFSVQFDNLMNISNHFALKTVSPDTPH